MASVNKVILVGNCGRDPEVRYLPSGQAVASFSMATSFRYKDKTTNEWAETVDWHRITLFGRPAEVAGEYLKKGQPVYVEGRLKYGKYTDQAGVERYTVEIVAAEFQLLGAREGRGGRAADGFQDEMGSPQNNVATTPVHAQRQAPAPQQYTNFAEFDDDIPF